MPTTTTTPMTAPCVRAACSRRRRLVLPALAIAGVTAASTTATAVLPGEASTASAPHSGGGATPASDSGLPAAASVERPLIMGRLERWLNEGDKDLIIQSFRRHPSEVLPFIDFYLEHGLKLIEGNASDEQAMHQFRLGVRFAQLATEALREPIFLEYAGSFASWNNDERRRFRHGQALHREGARALKNGDAGTARARFQASLELAEPLLDAWGTQMALCGLARAAFAAMDWKEAADTSIRAMEISGRLQLRGDEIDMLVLCAESRRRLNTPDAGLGHARLAWTKLKPGDPAEWRQRVGEAFAASLEATGRMDEAAKLRAEFCEPAPASAPAPSEPTHPPTPGGDATPAP